jgi:hypothetical protein
MDNGRMTTDKEGGMFMKITPNISNTWRVIYVVMGLAFMASPLVLNLPRFESGLMPVLGIVSIIEGALGY